MTRHDAVAILTMTDGENRMRPASVQMWSDSLDEVVASDAGALVVTGQDKFFSNGLDLDWVMANADETPAFFAGLFSLWARIVEFPMVTAAAINGHAFAGGAMMSMAFDFRVMRSDRGYWCLPEADLGLPLTPEMDTICAARLPPQTMHEAMVTGKRFGAEEAMSKSIVDATAPEADVLQSAIDLVLPYCGKDRETQTAIKATRYRDLLATLRSRAEG